MYKCVYARRDAVEWELCRAASRRFRTSTHACICNFILRTCMPCMQRNQAPRDRVAKFIAFGSLGGGNRRQAVQSGTPHKIQTPHKAHKATCGLAIVQLLRGPFHLRACLRSLQALLVLSQQSWLACSLRLEIIAACNRVRFLRWYHIQSLHKLCAQRDCQGPHHKSPKCEITGFMCEITRMKLSVGGPLLCGEGDC